MKLWKLAKESEATDEQIDFALKQEKGEVLPDMTEEEMHQHIKEHELGWGKYYEKIRNIIR